MMRPCSACQQNEWNFKKSGEYVQATCYYCGARVEWKPKPKKPKLILGSAPNPCPKCHRTMERRTGYPKPESIFYFRQFDVCGNCRHIQFYEEAKVYVDQKSAGTLWS